MSKAELIRDTMDAEIMSTSAMGLLASGGQVLKAREMDTTKGQEILIPSDKEEKSLRPKSLGPKLSLLYIMILGLT